METTTPRVYLLAHSQWVETDGRDQTPVGHWLETEHPGSEAISDTVHLDSERIVEMAGRRCYRSFAPGLNANVTKIRNDPDDYIGNLLRQGHGSVLEHFSATFAFEGVSRVFTHELVRHRVGCAYSQESLRYVRAERGFPMVLPDMGDLGDLTGELKQAMNHYLTTANSILEKADTFKKKKELTSAIRRMLPQGMATGIVATFNVRALRHIITMRTSEAAEWEMRQVFGEVAELCRGKFPRLFQDMVKVGAEDGGHPVYKFIHAT